MPNKLRKHSRKHSRKHPRKTRKHSNSSSQSYMNVSQTWKNGIGRRNMVIIRNGIGIKRVDELGPHGETLRSKTRRLTAPEQSQILKGQFVQGLWSNCRFGICK